MTKKKTEKKVKKFNRTLKKKKKFSFITKAIFSIFLLAAIAISYFLIIISAQEKSIPPITNKISSYLENVLHQKVNLKNSTIQITNRANLRLKASQVEIIDKNNIKTIIPRIEIEIPIFSAILGNFYPNKLMVSDAIINIDGIKKDKNQTENNNEQYFFQLIAFLNNLKKTYFINRFEIKNTKVIFNKKTIQINDFSIVTKYRKKALNIEVDGDILDKNNNIVLVNSICNLDSNSQLACKSKVKNFNPKFIINFGKEFEFFNKINAKIDVTLESLIQKNGLQNLSFNVQSKKGSFSYDGFFDKVINFQKLKVDGIYNNNSKFLNISNIDVDFSKNQNYDAKSANPNLKMSLVISNKNDLEMLFNISLSDIAINDLDLYWPNALAQNGIRDWVIEHGKNGFVTDANTKFNLKNNELEKITASLDIEGFDLSYGEDFPTIKNIYAKAEFSEKNMLIKIAKAEVLESKIFNSAVKIDDFSAKNVILEIDGKSLGHGSDLLQHVSYNSDFATHVKKRLNGKSINKFNIKLPLDNIDIRSLELKVFSDVKNISNDYIVGDVTINVDKKAMSDDFIVKFNNTAAKVHCYLLGVDKAKNIDSNFNFIVEVKNLDEITIDKIVIDENGATERKYVEGKIKFDIAPFKIKGIELENKNFSQNDYKISYSNNSKKIMVLADTINFRTILTKDFGSKEDKKSDNNSSIIDFRKIQIVANRLLLPNQKVLNDFYLFFNCDSGLCSEGIVKLLNKKNQFFELNLSKNNNDNFSTLKAFIPNVGDFIRAIGISDLVENGSAKIVAKNIAIDGKFVLEGTIELNNDITFYENDAVKFLERDNLFYQIKDKIFSNQKTTFNKIKINFVFKDNILEIKSLIARNYKIGITATGTIDLKNQTYDIKGAIIPGYLINNLFGIGSIPVIGNITSLVTGGKDSGIFGLQYEYYKEEKGEFVFKTNKTSSLLPISVKNLIDNMI